jgi:hypothetical protein
MPARYYYPLSIIVVILVIFSLFATLGRSLATGLTLILIFLLFGLIATSYTIIQKNRKACRQGKISRSVCIKNIVLEISVILFTMVLAALAGRYLSRMATENMNSHPVKLIAGIGIGILIGWAIGLFIKFVSSRFIETSSGS